MPLTRFNPPPNWPVPPGWTPPPGWEPDASWPPAPAGWQFFVDDAVAEPPPAEYPVGRGATGIGSAVRWNSRVLTITVIAATALAAVAGAGAYVYHRSNQPDIVILKPVDAQGNIQSGWTQNTSRANDHIDCSDGSPSRYDKGDAVRSCGATADSADACWPAPDASHVQCVQDPFSNEVYLIGASGLNTPRRAREQEPIPFALLLDDGTQCRVRIGGAWSSPQDQPTWVGHYGCAPHSAVWGPPDNGIDQGFGGWTVQVGSIDGSGPLIKHNVAKAYYVAAAAPGGSGGDGGNGSGGGGTRLVTKCGRTPQFVPETVHSDSGGLVIRMKIVAFCPGGDVLISPTTQISVTSGGQNVASGVFDLSNAPVVIPPGSGNGSSSPSVEHDFRFPLGTFWRLPVSTSEAPVNGASQQGAVDLDATTLVVACQESGSTTTTAPAGGSSAPSAESAATGPAPPSSGDNESASVDALRAIANSDRPFITSNLADRWVPQLSSKRPGVVDDGITWDNASTLREHLQLRLKYPEVRVLWTGDWSVFSAPDFWVTIAGVTFPDAGGALAWCRDHNLDRDHCYAKLVSTTHPVDDSTAFNP